jgi:hypothetical protein
MAEIQDLYRPPGWSSSAEPDDSELPKTSVLVVIFLTLITIGLYVPVWFLRRRKVLNRLSPARNVNAFIAGLVALYLGAFVLGITAGVEGAPQGQNLDFWTGVVDIASRILTLVLSFQVKAILEENYPDDISGVGTFFLSIFYLQYKINRLQPKGPAGSVLGLR